MNSVYHYESPEYSTFTGSAYNGSINFSTPRTGIGLIDNIAKTIVEGVINYKVRSQGGVILLNDVSNEESTWGILPTYNWSVNSVFYVPGATSLAFGWDDLIASLLTVIGYLIIAGTLYYAFKVVYFGPSGPGSGGISDIVNKYGKYILIGGGAIILITLLTSLRRKD